MQSILFKKNCVFDNKAKITKIKYITLVSVNYPKKNIIIKHNLKLKTNLVLLCIIFKSAHLLRNNVVRKKTGIIIKLDKLVIPSLVMIFFLINYTETLEEKYTIP